MEESIVFAPDIDERALDREVGQIDERLEDVGEISPQMDTRGLRSDAAGGIGGAASGPGVQVAQLEALEDIHEELEKMGASTAGGAGGGGGGGGGILMGLGIGRLLGGVGGAGIIGTILAGLGGTPGVPGPTQFGRGGAWNPGDRRRVGPIAGFLISDRRRRRYERGGPFVTPEERRRNRRIIGNMFGGTGRRGEPMPGRQVRIDADNDVLQALRGDVTLSEPAWLSDLTNFRPAEPGWVPDLTGAQFQEPAWVGDLTGVRFQEPAWVGDLTGISFQEPAWVGDLMGGLDVNVSVPSWLENMAGDAGAITPSIDVQVASPDLDLSAAPLEQALRNAMDQQFVREVADEIRGDIEDQLGGGL